MKLIASLLIAYVCASAGAVDFEAGIGASLYKDRGDGWWVQEAFPHKMELAAPSFQIGLTGDLIQRGRFGIAWHADWAWLGTVHTQSYATASDANYNLKEKRCNGSCWPMSNFIGSGHDQGFLFTLEPYYERNGWRYGVEFGPYIHKSVWAVNVLDWHSSADAPPLNITVQNENRWQIGRVVGASIGHKNFTLSYQYFMNQDRTVPGRDTFGSVWSNTHMLTLKYKF
jgi:hypothetical protein